METVSPHDVLIHRHQPDIEGETLAPRDRMTGSWSSGAHVVGQHTSESNREFDAQLRAMNSEWGVRNLEAMASEARTFNIELARSFQMPANNLVVVFRKS